MMFGVVVVDDESSARLRFDVIVQTDTFAGECIFESRKLFGQLSGDGLLDSLLNFLTCAAFDGGSGWIFASSNEASAWLGLDAVNELAESAFEIHGVRIVAP